MTTILALVGSLRADSLNRQIAELATTLAPAGTEVKIATGLGDIPFYNEDLDGDSAPEQAQALRAQVAQADALLLVTPEYNGGLPAVLKNGIDWLSRPFGQGAIGGKPVAALGAAMGQYGGIWAQQDSLKSAKIAGGVPHEEPAGSFCWVDWGEAPNPAEQPQVVDTVRTTLDALTRDVQDSAAA